MARTKRNFKPYLYVLYIAFILGVVAFILLGDPQMPTLGDALRKVRLPWLIPAVIGIMGFWFFDACTIHRLLIFVGRRIRWASALKVSLIGHFYAAITPCSTGSQPAQIVYLRRWGVMAADSTPVLVGKFLLWQVVEGLLATIAIPFCWNRLNDGLLAVALLGYVLNAMAAAGGILAVVKPGWVQGICRFFIRMGLKLHILKDEKRWLDMVDAFIVQYRVSIRALFDQRKKAVQAFFLGAGQILSYFLITYFIYLACTGAAFTLGSLMEILLMQSVLTMSVTFIPVPGASGTSEGGFYLFFGQVFPADMMLAAMLLWRTVTYYFNLFGGLAVVVADTVQTGIARRKGKAPATPPEQP